MEKWVCIAEDIEVEPTMLVLFTTTQAVCPRCYGGVRRALAGTGIDDVTSRPTTWQGRAAVLPKYGLQCMFERIDDDHVLYMLDLTQTQRAIISVQVGDTVFRYIANARDKPQPNEQHARYIEMCVAIEHDVNRSWLVRPIAVERVHVDGCEIAAARCDVTIDYEAPTYLIPTHGH